MRRHLALLLGLGLLLAPADAGLAGFSAPSPSVVPTGAYTSFTPTVTPASGSFTTLGGVVGRWQQTGKRVDLTVQVTITTNGTAAGFITISLPVAATSATATTMFGREIGVTGKALSATISSGSSSLSVVNADNTYPGANGYTLVLSGSYEAQ